MPLSYAITYPCLRSLLLARQSSELSLQKWRHIHKYSQLQYITQALHRTAVILSIFDYYCRLQLLSNKMCCIITQISGFHHRINDKYPTFKYNTQMFVADGGWGELDQFTPFCEVSCHVIETPVTYCISYSYTTGVAAAKLRRRLSNMNIIWRLWYI